MTWLCRVAVQFFAEEYACLPQQAHRFFSSLSTSYTHILQNMEDVYDGAIGIDLGTTYS